jgi:hypothetical protein
VLFSRRLQSDEAKRFVKLLQSTTKHGTVSDDLALAYLRHPEVVMFQSAVEDKIVGATCITKDKNRMGMVLAAVAVPPENRGTSAFSLLKASLPFFRTVTIRDVDLLVGESSVATLGFPLNQSLDPWTREVLSRIGFSEEQDMLQVEARLQEDVAPSSKVAWDRKANFDGARNLLWEVGRRQGLATSLSWTALDFAAMVGNLLTTSVKGEIGALVGLYDVKDAIVATPVLCDPHVLAPREFVAMLLDLARGEGKQRLVLPLVGPGQDKLLSTLEKRTTVTTSRATLMRKAV